MAGPGKPGPLTREEYAQRKAEIWQLRIEGHTQRDIAARYGITQQRVHDILDEVYGEITQPVAERLRIEQMHRLDNLRKAANGIIARHTEHDDPTVLAAMDRLLKVDAREAALFGLDAPQQVESKQYSYQVNGVSPEDLR